MLASHALIRTLDQSIAGTYLGTDPIPGRGSHAVPETIPQGPTKGSPAPNVAANPPVESKTTAKRSLR